ncbi:motility protein A [Schlesneria paludicola]|uniref:motility protein A n=1 Tax=Schlesneria paludicola TaxID=360056 RepID=UPI00029A6F20|nr:MotA/TolQ/ExbB proton channel family protein [Schlesneria paludicola]
MDIASILGLIIAFGIIGGAAYHQTHGNLMAFYSTEGVLLVIVGAICATMISLPMSNFLGIFGVMKKCFLYKETPLGVAILKLVEFAAVARKDGLLALEGRMAEVDEPFLAKGLRMVIDGQDHHDVESTLRLELFALGERHSIGKKAFAMMGNYAPAYGLMATIIGQVVMFQSMGGDISAIGAGLSVALLGTLYGSLFANIVCCPFADKLGIRAGQEMQLKELYLQGIMGIAAGDSPTALKQRLLSFLDGRTAIKVEETK